MRIGYLVSQYPATSHTFIRREIAALRERGLDIETFSIRKPHPEERVSDVEQAEMARTWYVLPPRADIVVAHARALFRHPVRYVRALADALRHRVPGLRALLLAFMYFGEAIYLADRLRGRRIEHLHNHFANPSANVGLVASTYLGIGWSVTLHGTSEFDYPAGLLLGAKLERARFAVCISHYTRAQALRAVAPAHWDKLFVSRCGVDPVFLDVRRNEAERRGRSGRLRILCVARLSPEKGLVGLLHAFHAVVRNGIDVELRIVGDGPDGDLLRRKVEELDLGDRVSLPGRVGEHLIVDELARADIFAISSFMEGLPVVLMEAMAQRVAVVAPRVAGIPELVEGGVTGLLFSPGHWDELTDRLCALSHDPSLRERLASAGRDRVLEQFDIRRAIEPLAARLEAL